MNKGNTCQQKRLLSIYSGADECDIHGDVERSLIAETVRIALFSMIQDGDNTSGLHLSNWVRRKIRSVVPRMNENDSLSSILYKEPTSMFELGEVIKDGSGQYLPSESKCLSISAEECLLISGMPSKYYSNNGVKIWFKGNLRIIKRCDVEYFRIQTIGINDFFSSNRFSKNDLFQLTWNNLKYNDGQKRYKSYSDNETKFGDWEYKMLGDKEIIRRKSNTIPKEWKYTVVDGKKIIQDIFEYQIHSISRDEYSSILTLLKPVIITTSKTLGGTIVNTSNINMNDKLNKELIVASNIFGEYRSPNFFIGDDNFEKFKEVICNLGIGVRNGQIV